MADAAGAGARPDAPERDVACKDIPRASFEPVYSATPDERFVMIEIASDESAPTDVRVVLDWPEELKRRIR